MDENQNKNPAPTSPETSTVFPSPTPKPFSSPIKRAIPDVSNVPPLPPIEVMPRETSGKNPPAPTFKPALSTAMPVIQATAAPRPLATPPTPSPSPPKPPPASSVPPPAPPSLPRQVSPPIKKVLQTPISPVVERTEAPKTAGGDSKKEFYSVVKPLRTFERDVAESIRGGQSVTSINLAAQKRRSERNEVVGTGEKIVRNSLMGITSIVLIAAALGTLGVVFYLKINKTAPPIIPDKTIISVDEKREINLAGEAAGNVILIPEIINVTKESVGAGSIVEIILTDSENKKISVDKFFGAFAVNAPTPLIRAFDSEWLFGFHSVPNGRNEVFIMLRLLSFDNAYAGMLSWEKDMAKNLGLIFLSEEERAIPIKEKFEDKLVKSKDVRVLKNARGEIVILYSFVDSNHLVIATNEQTLREILTRHQAAGLIR